MCVEIRWDVFMVGGSAWNASAMLGGGGRCGVAGGMQQQVLIPATTKGRSEGEGWGEDLCMMYDGMDGMDGGIDVFGIWSDD